MKKCYHIRLAGIVATAAIVCTLWAGCAPVTPGSEDEYDFPTDCAETIDPGTMPTLFPGHNPDEPEGNDGEKDEVGVL